jgi:chromosome segregation ATPase
MTAPSMNGNDAPVTQAQLAEELRLTRAELRQEMGDLRSEMKSEFAELRKEMITRSEMKSEIASAMAYVVDTLGARMDRMQTEMASMRDDLSRDLARHVRAAAEENRRFLATLDDKYRDLPGRVTVLERELDEHRRDTSLHPPRRRR